MSPWVSFFESLVWNHSKCMPAYHSSAGRFHFGLLSPIKVKAFKKEKQNNLVTGSWFQDHTPHSLEGTVFLSVFSEIKRRELQLLSRVTVKWARGFRFTGKIPSASQYLTPLARFYWKGILPAPEERFGEVCSSVPCYSSN